MSEMIPLWRFPYVAGENGGSVFVLFYLLFLLCMGVPVLTMELAVGRASRKSAVNGYKALEKPGSKWHIHGWLCMLGCYLLMMYYTTVSGWMISYFFKFLTGTFHGLDTEAVSGVFGSLLADPMEMGLWMAVTVIAGFLICSLGLRNGLERITKWMMGCLFVLILVLAVHSMLRTGIRLYAEGEAGREDDESCVTKWGWNFDNYLSEANKGEGMKMPGGKLVKNYFRFVLPVLILVILIQGLF